MINIYDFRGPTTINHKKKCESPKVNDPYDALVYFSGPTTYIHDSYHKTITLSIENDASPLR